MFKQIALTVVLVTTLTVITAAQQPNQFATGVRNSSGFRRLNDKQLQIIQESLRQKSGFVELSFNQNGVLTLGNRQNIAGGSAKAQALLIKAVDSVDFFELESCERSLEIAFAELQASNDRIDAVGKRTSIYQLRLDFADFNHLSGAREAKAAFDIGISLLHELTHGVLKLQDPRIEETDQIGECDAFINQIRRELQLPERLYYHPGIAITTLAGKRLVHARLMFATRATANSQPRAQYSLYWLPSEVSPKAQSVEAFQQGVLGARRR